MGLASWNPWRQCHSTLLEVTPGPDRLRGLYFLANENNKSGANDDDARQYTEAAFNHIVRVLPKDGNDLRLAFSGIGHRHPEDGFGIPPVDARVRLLVDIIANWYATYCGELNLTVHLMTTSDAFRRNRRIREYQRK